jgi:protein O-GlcNAc transferase
MMIDEKHMIDAIVALRAAKDFTFAEAKLHELRLRTPASGLFESHRLQQLGLLYVDTQRYAEALKPLQTALRSRPTDVQLLCEIGFVFEQLGDKDKAALFAERAAAIDPTHYLAQRNRFATLLTLGRNEEALSIADAIIGQAGVDHEMHSMWLFAAIACPEIDANALFQRHQQYAQLCCSHATRPTLDHRRSTAGGQLGGQSSKLHIGYFGHHFYRFPIASFLPSVLRAHDKSNFRVSIFSADGTFDEVSRQYVELVDDFYDLATMTDDEAADFIRSKGVQVLVDVSGLTNKNRFGIVCRRPADVHVSWLGYLGSTGSDAIDYHLTDRFSFDPNLHADLFSEKLIVLANSQFPYSPFSTDALPDRTADPQRVKLGYFGTAVKSNRRIFECIAQVMAACGNTSLSCLASCTSMEVWIRKIFLSSGVRANRVRFVRHLPLPDYLEQLRDCDLVLDSFPYTGGTTTCDALWMGTPVLSMCLPRLFGVAAASVLSAIGLTSMIVTDEASYIARATELCQNSVELDRIAAGLRLRMESSSLLDHGEFTRQLENVYGCVVANFRRGEKPQHFDVSGFSAS